MTDLDQHLHAIADEITVDIHVMGLKASALQDAVSCPRMILKGIEQGAVNIECNESDSTAAHVRGSMRKNQTSFGSSSGGGPRSQVM